MPDEMPDETRRDWPAFSLLFFASNAAEYSRGKFDLVTAATSYADQHGFEAVWLPERHFHAFGGIFPNPSLLGVLIAEHTERLRIRAGSVVLPLHSPIRVAEEWAIVDNLSKGRVDLAFAIGWNPNDFAIAPHNFENRKALTFEGIETVQRLWRGEEVSFPNGVGEAVVTRIYPAPVQESLTTWLTCSGGKERFGDAGARGHNVLTALLFQNVEELGEKIAAYRAAWREHGHPGEGQVTLMLHTYVGAEEDAVRDTVRGPFQDYLESSIDLWKGNEARLDNMSPRRRADLLEYAFERYYRTTALLGTPASCTEMVKKVHAAGVDEIACLIDFGVGWDDVVQSLEHLDVLRRGAGD